MRDRLAETLLARIMKWSPQTIAAERPKIQAMAGFKYNQYQQFSPGMQFIESLALWLKQFHTAKERQIAYDFVTKQLLFISTAEMYHLVSTAYHDCIRPRLLEAAATELKINQYHLARIAVSKHFRVRQRQTLFLGLSDGARTDIFRRVNRQQLDHEQILQSYEISKGRGRELRKKLGKALSDLCGACTDDDCRFRTVVFLDDFSGSGYSFLRRSADGEWGGKLYEFFKQMQDSIAELFDLEHLHLVLILYVASESAARLLKDLMTQLWAQNSTSVFVIHSITSDVCIHRTGTDPICALLNSDDYFDPQLCDSHIEKGNTDGRYGFADGGLPLVLSHNAPNNSISLLWSYEYLQIRGLFPRVSRHKNI